MKRLMPILLWSAISAAFIGPGTVTTAAAAGAGFGLSLVWALVFSTLACLALQEAAGRLTAVSGLSLGQAMQQRFGRKLPWALVSVVVLGCAAYQAGNILGAVVGATLITSLHRTILTLATGALALILLWAGGPQRVARLIGVAVALMGIAFLICAIDLAPDAGALLGGALVPSLPDGSAMLVLGLIGTTVVPYNLFLGSGLARGQKLSDIRLGLAVAVPLGGVISIGILISATALDGQFSFEALAGALGSSLGTLAPILFAFGLFAAGLSSAVTAPLASALAVQSLVKNRERFGERSLGFRAVWLSVLCIGLFFGLAGVKPIPAIILAQALNGVLLPLVAVFLLIATNDSRLMGPDHKNGWFANAAMGLSCLVSLVLGGFGILKIFL